MRIGLFLDRDGTINEEVEFLSSPDNVRLIPGAAEAIRRANALGIPVIIITNQSGIARGLFTEQDLDAVNAEVLRLLQLQGARIDAVYYCPHHPEGDTEPFDVDCECRKPKTGLLEQAAKEFSIDLSRSFMIGDRLSDVMAGNSAGAVSILVRTGFGEEALRRRDSGSARIDFVAKDIAEAIHHMIEILSAAADQPISS
jgi:D-glycero-D-manno-heptose 1,7-bisphosphate phosphatase